MSRDRYFTLVEEYLDEKGIEAAVGPYGLTTLEKQKGCKVKLTNISKRMWSEVLKPFFVAEADRKGMIYEDAPLPDQEDGFISRVVWIRTENIVALGGPMKGVHQERKKK